VIFITHTNNAFNIRGDRVVAVLLTGRGAGAAPTGSAIVGDIIYCATHLQHNYSTFDNTEKASPSTKFVSNFESAYYIRLSAEDKAGVLSKVTSVLGRNSISVAQIIQEEDKDPDGKVPIIVVTHVTHEHNVLKAVQDINSGSSGAAVSSVIRVYD
ncbi:MAG: ACT domain-containing protein, partial [Clostridia bacterium]|nr:ACT domain-containing protein [Clostridia bacterium]